MSIFAQLRGTFPDSQANLNSDGSSTKFTLSHNIIIISKSKIVYLEYKNQCLHMILN
jgi:hypothetical protein